MILTDDQKQQAKDLGLTVTEARFAIATRIPLDRYAFHKRELQAGRDAWEAKLEGTNAAMMTRASYFAPYTRGDGAGLASDDSSSEDGG